MSNPAPIDALDALIDDRHLLKHPFYVAWRQGRLSRSALADYAAQYHHHIAAFPTYLSALHSRCSDYDVRRHLAQNLYEEEVGEPNHREMWLAFAAALDRDAATVEATRPRAATAELVEVFRRAAHGTTVEGLAAVYAYESMQPAVATSKAAGLRAFYGVHAGAAYFDRHAAADVEHARIERNLLEGLLDESNLDAALASANRALDALWRFLDDALERAELRPEPAAA